MTQSETDQANHLKYMRNLDTKTRNAMPFGWIVSMLMDKEKVGNSNGKTTGNKSE